MSAPHLMSIARGCRAYVLFCLLAIPASGFGQILAPIEPINPIIGPMVRIVSPADHIVFFTPVDIPVLAYVIDTPYTDIISVQFYAGTNYIGSGFRLGILPPIAAPMPDFVLPGRPITRLGAMYCMVWTNVPPGSYALTAVVESTEIVEPMDDIFTSRTSAPVNITVLPRTT